MSPELLATTLVMQWSKWHRVQSSSGGPRHSAVGDMVVTEDGCLLAGREMMNEQLGVMLGELRAGRQGLLMMTGKAALFVASLLQLGTDQDVTKPWHMPVLFLLDH